jgi:hypothetical protein
MNANIFRVDKFIVSGHARGEFLAKVQATHKLLRSQPGFVRDYILEQVSGPGEFNFVTIVEWEGSEYMEPARQAVAALHERMNCNPSELLVRLGVRADIANYRGVDLASFEG